MILARDLPDSGFHLGNRSLSRLLVQWDNGLRVHADLVAVVRLAIKLTPVDFTVLECVRSLSRQKALLEEGATTTLNSRHLTGHAVDLGAWVAGDVSWHFGHYNKIAEAMKTAAEYLGVPIEWGGEWKTFPDGPHFQLPRRHYQ